MEALGQLYPAGQPVQVVDPFDTAMYPVGQTVQSETDASPVTLLAVPAGHGTGYVLLTVQKCPATHGSH